jgi:hypothetical protein
MDQDRIHVELIVNRRYRNMPPAVQAGYQTLREAVRVLLAAGIAWILFRNLQTGPALGLTAGLLWLLIDPWVRRESPGTSHVLLTDDGVYVMDEGLYCDWPDVKTHSISGDVLTFEAGGESAPSGPFARRKRRIPLGRETGQKIRELFDERAGARPQPPT